MKRFATAVWKGNGKNGEGILNTESTVLKDANYSYKTRFENGVGTNPEELIAAAHAGCFCMKLAFILQEAGFTPEKLKAKCEITLEGGVISVSHIKLEASVPNLPEEDFALFVKNAKENCPVSQVLKLETKVLYSLENE